MPPAVSVVIATYNYGRFLGEAIESVVSQDYAGLELVIIDDGSTDDTAEVVRPWRHRLTYVRQESRGLYAARNLGIARTSAPHVAFLDADDAWEPGALLALNGAFRRQPRLGLVASAFQLVDAKGAPVGPPFRKKTPGDRITTESLLLRDFDVPGCIYRREALVDAGLFPQGNPWSGDYEMWLRMAQRWEIHWIAAPHLRKRYHGTNMSANAHLTRLHTVAAVERFAADHPDYAQRNLGLLRRAQSRNHERLAKACLRSRRPELLPLARESLTTALRLNPFRLKVYELKARAALRMAVA